MTLKSVSMAYQSGRASSLKYASSINKDTKTNGQRLTSNGVLPP